LSNKITSDNLAKSITFVFLTSGFRWLLGCMRIVIVAFLFGATFAYDAYLVAFTIPEMISGLLVGVIAVTFIPIFTEHLCKDGEAKAWNFVSSLINLIFLFGILLMIVMVGIAPFLLRIVAPGFDQKTFQLAAHLLMVMIPFILIISLAELFTLILNTYQRFTVPALIRIVEVATSVLCLIYLSKKYGIFSLAIGLLLGAIARLVLQVPILWKKFRYYHFGLNLNLPGIKKINLLLGPMVFCMLFFRVGMVIERILASNLKEGSISILGYANTLASVPSEIFLNSLGVVLFPLISKYAVENKLIDFKATFSKGIRIGNFILVPIAILFIFFGKPIISALLERGRFTSLMTQDMSIALAIYALGLLAMATFFFSAHACYALQEVKITIKIAILVTILNIIMKLILINYLSFAGLALATSVALIVQSGLLLRFVIKKIGSIHEKIIALSALKTLAASILMTGTCWLLFGSLVLDSHSPLYLPALIGTAGLSYLVFSYLLRSEELTTIKEIFRKMLTSIA